MPVQSVDLVPEPVAIYGALSYPSMKKPENQKDSRKNLLVQNGQLNLRDGPSLPH